MKLRSLAIAAAFVFSTLALAEGSHEHAAKHGGIVVGAKSLDFEVVARPELLQVYVSDHGKPVKLDGATGKVTLLNGAEKTEVLLLPAGGRFEARGVFKVAAGTKGLASVTLAGKGPVVVRFAVK
jgi:hypothetical protein